VALVLQVHRRVRVENFTVVMLGIPLCLCFRLESMMEFAVSLMCFC
jgi:hypothetical protein